MTRKIDRRTFLRRGAACTVAAPLSFGALAWFDRWFNPGTRRFFDMGRERITTLKYVPVDGESWSNLGGRPPSADDLRDGIQRLIDDMAAGPPMYPQPGPVLVSPRMFDDGVRMGFWDRDGEYT